MTTFTTAASGNDDAGATWVGGVAPSAGDDIVIAAHTLTLNRDIAYNSITFNNASARLAIGGTNRSVEATNGLLFPVTLSAQLITTAIPSGTSLTLIGKISGAGAINSGIASSTGGNLTLQTVGGSSSGVLFEDYTGAVGRVITSSWTGGTLTTIGRFNLPSWTGTSLIVQMSGGTWVHQSTGTNYFGSSNHRIGFTSGTATINWTGSVESYSNTGVNGIFTLGSSSATHTIGQAGDIICLKNNSASNFTTLVSQSAGTVELVGTFLTIDGAFLTYQSGGTCRYRNQSMSIPAGYAQLWVVYGGNIDMTGLVVTNAGKFSAFVFYQSASFTTSAGTSVTCSSTSAFAIAVGTTSFNGKIIILESSPPTLPAVQDVASGEVYGYTGIELTGTGLILDPAVLAAAMVSSFGSLPEVLVKTTIATLASQTSFTLMAGSADDDAYNDKTLIVTDQLTSVQKAVVTVSAYTGASKDVTLSGTPVFTIAVGDLVTIIAGASSGGSSFPVEAPADWIKPTSIEDGAITSTKFAAGATVPRVTLVDTLTTYASNTPQTGDSYAIVNNGTYGSAALKAILDIIAADTTTDIPALIATLQAFVDTEVAAIKAKTDNLPSDPADQSAIEAAITAATSPLATAANLALIPIDGTLTVTLANGVTHGGSTAMLRLGSSTTTPAFYVVNSSSDDNAHAVYFKAGSSMTGGAGLLIDGGSLQTTFIAPAVEGLYAGGDSVAHEGEIIAIKAKTDNLPSDPADQSAVEAAITAATSPLATAANLTTVAGYLDTEIAAILADTNELQTDWVNGGRLDLILDARASQTSVDDLPTNAELATALGTADDDVLAAISTLQTSVNTIDDFVDTEITAIKAKTDLLVTFPTNFSSLEINASGHISRVVLVDTTTTNADLVSAATIATTILTTQMTESYSADGVAPTLAQALFLMQQAFTEFVITGTSISVKKLDGVTEAAAYTMNSSTLPTQRLRTS